MVDFLRKRKDRIKAYLTMHSYSQMVLFPYSYTKNISKDHDELVRTLLFKSKLKRAFVIGFWILIFSSLKKEYKGHFFIKKKWLNDECLSIMSTRRCSRSYCYVIKARSDGTLVWFSCFFLHHLFHLNAASHYLQKRIKPWSENTSCFV